MHLLDLTAVRFLLVGGANTAFGLFVIYTCKWLLELDDVFANLTGYIAGLTLSFALNRRWTFRYDGMVLPALARFVLVLLVAYLANLATVLIAIASGVDSYLAQAIGIAPYTILGYLGSRLFAFPTSGARSRTPS